MTDRILLAYDGSASSDKAFDFALTFAKKFEVPLYLLSIIRLPEPPDEVETTAFVESATSTYHQIFGRLHKKAQDEGITLHCKSVVGHPAEQIIKWTNELEINHVIVGSHGKGLFQRILLGSVSKQIAIYAPCSVTIVR